MKIRCHQVVQGHSTKDAYAAGLVVSQKENGSGRSFDFPFSDSRREISDDKNNYVLEIEPIDSAYQRTAAICSQWKTVGSPSKYTHWLIPEDCKTETVMRLMNRDYFMDGSEMSDLYETSKVLKMKEIDIADEALTPRWNMNDTQKKTLFQFLALYWSCLTKRSMGVHADIQLPLILRDENTNEILTGERAAAFFAREIVSRMPLEAQGGISAAFGIRWSEAQTNFKKTVCAVLSTETGVSPDKKIDLVNNNKDLLSKYSHNDREAMNTIGKCLLEGEGSFPEWYLKLRSMKDGIPGSVAPNILYICYMLKELDKEDASDPKQKTGMMEKCYSAILMQITNAKGDLAEAQRIMLPLANRIISLWETRKHPEMEYYTSKRNWAMSQTGMSESQVTELMEPLAKQVFEEIRTSGKISSAKRIEDAVNLLRYQQSFKNSSITGSLEQFVAQHFDEWLQIPETPEKKPDPIDIHSFERILDQWNIHLSKAEPEVLVEALNKQLAFYPDLDETTRSKAIRSLHCLWIKDRVDKLIRSEKTGQEPTVNELKALADHIKEAGKEGTAGEISRGALSYIEQHYLIWINEEPAIVRDDERFLSVAQNWAEKQLPRDTEDYVPREYDKLEKNLMEVLDYYHVSVEETDRTLLGLRSLRGKARLKEIVEDTALQGMEKAVQISDLHYLLNNEDVFSKNDQLENDLTMAMMPYFLQWEKTTPPFTSIQNARYKDNWFISAARAWISNCFSKEELKSAEIENLITDLKTAFKAYHLEEQEQNEILLPLRKNWRISSITELHENGENYTETEKALQIAEIHNRLCAAKKSGGEEFSEDNELLNDMLDVFLAWSEAEKPFSSGLEQKYTDDWFVTVAEEWIKHELQEQNLTSEELEALESKIVSVLKQYQVDEARRNDILIPLREKWGEVRLLELRGSEADTEKAISIAEIHDRLRKYGCDFAEDSILEAELRHELLEHYIEWEKASRAFVSNHESKYTDNWFVSITDEWLDRYLEDAHLGSAELEKLEADILDVLKVYKSEEEIRNKTRICIRKLWSDQKRIAVEADPDLDDTKKALEIAGIHSHLRKIYNTAPIEDEIQQELGNALIPLFVAWGEATKPFASNSRLTYDDDWFIDLAKEWLALSMHDIDLTCSQLEQTEKKLTMVFNIYKLPKEEQSELLLPMKTLWGEAKLRAIQDDTSDDRTAKALAIAGIHNQLRKSAGAIEDGDNLELELCNNLEELFLDWQKAAKPFASSETLRYEDDWLIRVAREWISTNYNEINVLSSQDLEKLKKDLTAAFNYYRDRNSLEEILLPLTQQWGRVRLQELEQLDRTPQNILQIVDIHNQLRKTDGALTPDIEEALMNDALDSFAIWGQATKPFASGDAMRYEDSWFGSVFSQWVRQRMDREYLKAEELQDLVRQLEEACRSYHLTDSDSLLKEVKKRYADIYISENLGGNSEDKTNAQMAELLFRDRVVSVEEDLKDRLINHLAGNFVSWASSSPAFAIGTASNGGFIYGQGDTFIRIYEAWQNDYLEESYGQANLTDVKESVKKAFDTFRIPQKSLDEHSEKLDAYIKKERMETIRNTEFTPDTISEAAGIRRWFDEHRSISGHLDIIEDSELIIKDHIYLWLQYDKPLWTDGYGYKDDFAVQSLENWMAGQIERLDWRSDELRDLKKRVEQAQREFKFVGKVIDADVLQKWDLLEHKAFINELPDGKLDVDTVKELADRLAALGSVDPQEMDPYIFKLAENYKTWALADPSFSCRGCKPELRDALIEKVTNEWLSLPNEADEISATEIGQIKSALKTTIKYPTASEREMLDHVEVQYFILRLMDIRSKIADHRSPEDVSELALIYLRSRRAAEGKLASVESQAYDSLLEGFSSWSNMSSFRLPQGNEDLYNETDFYNISSEWIKRLPSFSRNHDVMTLEKVCHAIDLSGRSLWKLSQSEASELILGIKEFCCSMIIEALESADVPDNAQIEYARNIYAEMIDNGRQDSREAVRLKDSLLKCFKIWIGKPVKHSHESIILPLTKEWVTENLKQESQTELVELEKVIESIGDALHNINASKLEQNSITVPLEKQWLNSAMRTFPANQVKLSRIASRKFSIESRNGSLDAQEELTLRQFLVSNFLPWEKEEFESEEAGRIYTYSAFPDVIKDWIKTSKIKQLSFDKANHLENTIINVLSKGYGFSKDQCQELLRTFTVEKNYLLLDEAGQNISESNLQMIARLYEKSPVDYYQQVFRIYTNLIKQGIAKSQVIEFFALQDDIWKGNQDPELRKGIISFLGSAYTMYVTSNRPNELVEVMSRILDGEQFDLSRYITDNEELQGWNQLKEQILDHYTKRLFKESGSLNDLQETWEKRYYYKCHVYWRDLIGRESFSKELKNAINRGWNSLGKAEDEIPYLQELMNLADRTEETVYKKILLETVLEIINDNYSKLADSPASQNELESILRELESYSIDTSSILNTEEYISKHYMTQCAQLAAKWDRNTAVGLLIKRPAMMNRANEILTRRLEFTQNEEWLLMNLLREAPKEQGYGYWNTIISGTGFVMKELDEADLKEPKVTTFIRCLQWIHDMLRRDEIYWALDDLRGFLKSSAPAMWKELHPSFSIFGSSNVLKKMGMDRSQLSDEFSDWLLKSK